MRCYRWRYIGTNPPKDSQGEPVLDGVSLGAIFGEEIYAYDPGLNHDITVGKVGDSANWQAKS